MAKLKLIITLTISCGLWVLINSCLDVPLEVTIQRELKLSEKTVKNTANQIKERLPTHINFAHPPGSAKGLINPDECKNAFKFWLDEQFKWGYLPKKIISPLEYAKSSKNPLAYQCNDIDLSTDFEITAAQIAGEMTGEIILFTDVQELGDSLRSNKCIGNFVDPAKEKLEIVSINLEVKKNTLNTSALNYTIYTSDKIVTEEMINKSTVQDLIKDGTYRKLVDTPHIPPKFVGTLPIDLGKQKDNKSVGPLITLKGSVVAYPKSFSGKPETTQKAGQTYYVVPDGSILAFAKVIYRLKTNLQDAFCFYYQFIDDIKEEERNRQES